MSFKAAKLIRVSQSAIDMRKEIAHVKSGRFRKMQKHRSNKYHIKHYQTRAWKE